MWPLTLSSLFLFFGGMLPNMYGDLWDGLMNMEKRPLIILFPQLASLPGTLQGPLAAPFHSIHGCDGGSVLCSVVQQP